MYMTGYSGATKTLEELKVWGQYTYMEPEFARRVLALMDASIAAGHPVGIGNTWRSSVAQRQLFLARHHVSPTGSITFEGQKWALNAGAAPSAPPGQSYHESTAPTQTPKFCLAVDFVGDTAWAERYASEFDLVTFGSINGEPWHAQPAEIPHGRSGYSSKYEPLGSAATVPPPPPKPPVPVVVVPKPTIRSGVSGPEVMKLQAVMQFWGWYPKTYKCDGVCGPVTAWCIAVMQKALNQKADGVYGTVTAGAYLWFATVMQGVAK